MKKYKRSFIIIATIIILFIIGYVSIFDCVSNGFYCKVPTYTEVSNAKLIEKVNINGNGYEVKFKPEKDHFAGIEVMLTDINSATEGKLIIKLQNSDDKIIEIQEIELKLIKNNEWYIIQTKANLKENEEYKISFMVENEIEPVNMWKVRGVYVPTENINDTLLIGYGYHNSTFKEGERCLIAIALIAIWILIITSLFTDNKKKKIMKTISIFLLLTTILSWIYMYNSIDNKNTKFETYQADSEGLVTGMIKARETKLGIPFAYGLGQYYNTKGKMDSYNVFQRTRYLNDNNWEYGYSKNEPTIIISENPYTRMVAIKGNSIRFDNDNVLSIKEVKTEGIYRKVSLDSSEILKYQEYGDIDKAKFYNAKGEELQTGLLIKYQSQYGLQGKVFGKLYKYVDSVNTLNLLCALGTAMIFSIIVILVKKKYNILMAGCFFVTFLLSPWIVNFARNLYWVEFTWFLPMVAGLICSIWIDKKWCRVISYLIAFISILIKCLCGYEYITTIMLGMISFLLVDLVVAIVKKEKEKIKTLLKSILITGIIAILAFALAIIIHANIKGNGNIIEGIKIIIQNDVLRRTSGANLNDFSQSYWDSFNASIWETLCIYYHFPTEVIAGVEGNTFALVWIIPILIMIYNIRKQKYDVEDIVMYIVFWLTTASWFVLAKSHSYVHKHMNYVLWYFGYIQICFYIIIKQIMNFVKKNNKKEDERK